MRAYADRSPGVRLVTDPPPRPAPAVELPDPHVERDLVALCGRINSGFGVQLLLDRQSHETFITCTLGEETETFPVPPSEAMVAFHHPYIYGATLAL